MLARPVDSSEAWLEALRADGARRQGCRSPSFTACCFARRASRSAAAAPRSRSSAARSSTISPCRRRTTHWWPCSPSSTPTAGPAASPPGRTSSPCSRPACGCGGGRGRAARSCSSPRAGRPSPTGGRRPNAPAEDAELLRELQRAVREELTPHQRDVFVALALNEVPIDVLAERLDTTRGALYKTLHDARTKLRRELAASGYMQEDS